VRTRGERVKSQRADALDHVEHGTYFVVRIRPYDGKQASALERAAKRAAVHFASSIVSLQWALRHRAFFKARRSFWREITRFTDIE
jgi:hypothetical protein